jgi:alkylated DNA nucleotide flippase Atl1
MSWEENLYKFQAGQLSEQEEEWHRLVSTEARESLPKQEVQRQSVLFEVIKSEKEYVSDIIILKEVSI